MPHILLSIIRLGEFPAFANWPSRLAIVDLPGGLLDSSAMVPRDWERIACFIYRLLPYYSGFIVIHGTDTLAYTASALSFVLRSISKSVVVTGAQVNYSLSFFARLPCLTFDNCGV
jgi:L-asparaginase/Glu-tRNA(Gln) amidotransferase subunit D